MSKNKKFLRQCIACKEPKNKENLIRITKDHKDNKYKLNQDSSIQGYSIYICKNKECIDNALKSKKYKTFFNTNVSENIKEMLYSVLNE